MADKLTARELRLVREIQRREDLDPDRGSSYEELRMALGLRSRSGIARMVRSLSEKGWVTQRTGKKRTLALARRLTAPEVTSGPDPGPSEDTTARGQKTGRTADMLESTSDEDLVAEVRRRGLHVPMAISRVAGDARRRAGEPGHASPAVNMA